jgi:hypothetical protein
MKQFSITNIVIGILVGADPQKRLKVWAPGWAFNTRFIRSELDYHDEAPVQEFDGVQLDPIYEAKVIPYLGKGDLFWVVGKRRNLE